MENSHRKRVLCPVSGRDGKTYWMRSGAAYPNKDGSWNVYLDMLPLNGKLQIRDWDEPREKRREGGETSPLFGEREDMPF